MLMNKFFNLTLSTAITGLLFASPVMAQDKTASVLNPSGKWSVKAVSAETENGYCALSRQYDGNLIVTVGQNKREEYSFALDFVNASLNPDRAYDVTLQPGPGQIRAYEMMPASARAMVIRLGYDDSFIRSLEKSGELKAEIDGKTYTFNLSEFGSGNRSLEKCMASLTSSSMKMASTKSGAEKKTTIKIERSEPVKAMPAAEVVKSVPTKAVSIKEPVTSMAANTPKSEVERIAEAEASKVIEAPRPPVIEISKVDSKVIEAEAESIAQADVQAKAIEQKAQEMAANQKAKLEAEKLKKVEAAARAEQERKAQEEFIAMKAQEKAEQEKAVKEKAEQERLASEEKARKALELQKRAAEKVEAEKADQLRLAAQQQRKSEVAKLALITPEPDMAVPSVPDVPTGRTFEKRHEVLKTSKAKEAMSDLGKLEAENSRLSQALAAEEKKMATLDRNAPEAQAELEKIKARMSELEQENRALYLEARKARGEIDTAVVATSNQALAKMREYEKKLEAARADNVALSKEIEELRLLKENSKLDIVAGDWDLEKSTGRYNEAEREIKRLGLLLEQQRLAHRQEKEELEQMLFDPAVTDRAQRARLAELEAQLSAAERQLQTGQRGMARSSITTMSAPRVPRAPLSERVDAMGAEAQRFPKIEDTPMAISARQAPIEPKISVRQSARQPAIVPRQEVAPRQVQRAPVIASNAPVSRAPVTPVARAPVTAPNATVASLRQAPVMVPSTFSVRDIQSVLNKAGINLNGSILQRQAGQYQWQSGKLSGYAEIMPQAQAGSLKDFVNNYITAKERACVGDFASLPAPMVETGRGFEVACITPTSSMSSSLVFKEQGNNIIVIGHDIPAEDMDLAMDARDRIAQNL